jgi:hypothetical protein
LVAPCAVSPVTSGTVEVGGAFAITRLIVAPGDTRTCAAGLWLITSPSGADVVVSVEVVTWKP